MGVDPFLAADDVVDHDHPQVVALARRLRSGDPVETARRSFEWVRDEVRHSGDARAETSTCSASSVLLARTGWCFAKSHLLVALLRANGLRAGFGYQRLSLDGSGAPFTLHGLVAVELPGVGWYRCDPRGDKPGIATAFTPPVERLAFTPSLRGEWDDPTPWAEPWPEVVACLTRNHGWAAVLARLPDRARAPSAAFWPA